MACTFLTFIYDNVGCARFSHESVGEGEERHLVLERCPETSMYVETTITHIFLLLTYLMSVQYVLHVHTELMNMSDRSYNCGVARLLKLMLHISSNVQCLSFVFHLTICGFGCRPSILVSDILWQYDEPESPMNPHLLLKRSETPPGNIF